MTMSLAQMRIGRQGAPCSDLAVSGETLALVCGQKIGLDLFESDRPYIGWSVNREEVVAGDWIAL